jgi:hypothetical protein
MSDTTPEIKALDCNGKELKVGDTVIVKSVAGYRSIADRFRVGDLVTVTGFGPVPYEGWLSAVEVTVDGMSTGQFAYRYEFYSRPTCCTLQEAADLLEGAGVLVDHAALERAINPRPQTLPCKRIRLREQGGLVYVLVQSGPNYFQLIGPRHNRWDEGFELEDSIHSINLDNLSSKVPDFTILDTWSENTEFPELLGS